MSVCEGCPCDLQPYVETAGEGTCALGVKFQKDEFDYSIRPSNCPYASILKLLMEAEEVLTEQEVAAMTLLPGIPMATFQNLVRVEFWIRRKS